MPLGAEPKPGQPKPGYGLLRARQMTPRSSCSRHSIGTRQKEGSQPREPMGKGRPNHHLLPRGTWTQVSGPLHSGRLIKTAETHRPPSRPCSGTCRPEWQLWKSVPVHPPALSARSLGARVLEQPISCEGGGRPEGWSSPRDAQNHAMTRECWWPGLAAGWQVLRWGQTPEQHRHKCPQGLPCEQLSQMMLHRQASRLSQSSRHCLLQGALQH